MTSDNEKANFDAVAQQAINSSLNQASVILPGPTGETNTLSWHAPKQVALYGGSQSQALDALAILAANGIITRFAHLMYWQSMPMS